MQVWSSESTLLLPQVLNFNYIIIHDYSNFTTYPFHDLKIASLEPKKEKLKNQLIIGNDVWIGTNAAILGGIVIGNGAVIAANAVVTKNVEPYSIVAGNPAKILKYRFSEEVCRTLDQMKWWNWPEKEIIDLCEKEHGSIDHLLGYYKPEESESYSEFEDMKKVFKIYVFILDFQQQNSLWRKIVKEYVETFANRDKVMLILVEQGMEDKKYMEDVFEVIRNKGNCSPNIMKVLFSEKRVVSLLKNADYFITSRDHMTGQYFDYACTYGARILFGTKPKVFARR